MTPCLTTLRLVMTVADGALTEPPDSAKRCQEVLARNQKMCTATNYRCLCTFGSTLAPEVNPPALKCCQRCVCPL